MGLSCAAPWGLTEPFVSTRPSFALQFVRGRVFEVTRKVKAKAS